MKCENCRAWNAHVIYLEDEKWILCPRCLSILKNLNDEYQNIVGVDDIYTEELPVRSIDEAFSSGHIVDEHS